MLLAKELRLPGRVHLLLLHLLEGRRGELGKQSKAAAPVDHVFTRLRGDFVFAKVIRSVPPVVALEEWLLEVQNPARSLITGGVLAALSVGGGSATLHSSRSEFSLACHIVALDKSVPYGRHIGELLRDLVTQPVDVVLENEVVHLARVAGANTWQATFDARTEHELLLLELEIPVELLDHLQLVQTQVLLVQTVATLLSAQEDYVLVDWLAPHVLLLRLELFVGSQRLVATVQVTWVHLVVVHQGEHFLRLLRGHQLRVGLV